MILRAFHHDGFHYQLEEVRCCKPGCRRCPHGPYWYRYSPTGIAPRKRYMGKRLPAGVGPEAGPLRLGQANVELSPLMARGALGLNGTEPYERAFPRYQRRRAEIIEASGAKCIGVANLDHAWKVWATFCAWI